MTFTQSVSNIQIHKRTIIDVFQHNKGILGYINKAGIAPTASATNHSLTRDEVPDGAFFIFVSKGFSGAIRLSETGLRAEIGL